MQVYNQWQIIQGLDGSYVVKDGKLIKIIRISYSEKYFIQTGEWVEYELEDGMIIKFG